MKNVFTLLLALFLTSNIYAQNIIFSEDFEGELSGWTVGDLDGDGFNWETVFSSDQAEGQGWGPDMTTMVGSFGYSLLPGEEQPLYPDNVLVTPSIDFPESSSIQLRFLLGTNIDYLNDHNFALYAVNEFATFDDTWEPIFEMNFAAISTAQDITIDLSDFAGTTQQLVMRHYNSDEQFVLLLDDIIIESNPLDVTDYNPAVRLSIYPNPAQDIVHIKTLEPLTSAKVYNVQGKLLLSSKSEDINIQNLPKGLYVLKVTTATEKFTKKLIKD